MIKLGNYTFQPEDWKDISDEAKDLVSQLLKINYKERFSPSEALAHRWILHVNLL